MSITLGIFHGKKGHYNRLILKSLLFSTKTTTQIAEYIYDNDMNELNKNRRNAVLRIFSVISRKGGRLSELSDKKYILKDNSKWGLTLKGACLSLSSYEDNEIRQYVDFKKVPKEWDLVKIVDLIQRNPLIDALLSTKKGKELIDGNLSKIEKKQSPQFWERIVFKIRDATRDMVSKGVDIDAMEIMEFSLLLGTNISSFIINTIFQDSLKAK